MNNIVYYKLSDNLLSEVESSLFNIYKKEDFKEFTTVYVRTGIGGIRKINQAVYRMAIDSKLLRVDDEKSKIIKSGVTDSGESYTTFIVPFLVNVNFIADSYNDKPGIGEDGPIVDNLPITSYSYSFYQRGKDLITLKLEV